MWYKSILIEYRDYMCPMGHMAKKKIKLGQLATVVHFF